MDNFLKIKQHVAQYIHLTEDEEKTFVSLLRMVNVRKKQFIVQPEFTCKHRSYVVNGAMRAYLIDERGHDHTIQFAIEDWWISDFSSYINQEPATLFVEALEDTVLIQIEYSSESLLLERIPKFEKYLRIITQRSFAFLQKRLLSNLSKSAEERYKEFLEKYPSIVNRVPQYAMASYLGFSTEFLSKIRNRRIRKN